MVKFLTNFREKILTEILTSGRGGGAYSRPRVATGCISPGHRDNIYSPGVAHGVVTVLLVGATVLSLDAVMFAVIPVIVVLETVVGRIIVVSDG